MVQETAVLASNLYAYNLDIYNVHAAILEICWNIFASISYFWIYCLYMHM